VALPFVGGIARALHLLEFVDVLAARERDARRVEGSELEQVLVAEILYRLLHVSGDGRIDGKDQLARTIARVEFTVAFRADLERCPGAAGTHRHHGSRRFESERLRAIRIDQLRHRRSRQPGQEGLHGAVITARRDWCFDHPVGAGTRELDRWRARYGHFDCVDLVPVEVKDSFVAQRERRLRQ
jgi:hypothetical protein